MPGGFDQTKRYTSEEYFAFEDATDERLEMFGGYIRVKGWPYVNPNLGPSVRHSALVGNAHALLRQFALTDGGEVYDSDVRIPGPDGGAVSADVVFVRSPEWITEEPALLANPFALVEVTSSLTEGEDLVRKLGLYRDLPSLQVFLAISSEHRAIDVYWRESETRWFLEFHRTPGPIHVPLLDLNFHFEEVYRGVDVGNERPMPHLQVPPDPDDEL